MTHERDLERLLDSWFAEGPLVVADRVIDDAAARIGRQRQRPAWRLRTWRIPTMSSPLKLVLVGAALLAALATGTVFLSGGGPRPAPTPSPTPSTSPTSTPIPPSPSPSPSPTTVYPAWFGPGGPGAGILPAGTNASRQFLPGFSFRVPAGWVNDGDYRVTYTLFPDSQINRDEYARSKQTAENLVVTEMVANNMFAICDATGLFQGATASEVLDAVVASPAFRFWNDEPVDVTIGGLHGRQVDLRLSPEWKGKCTPNPDDPPTRDYLDVRNRVIVLDKPVIGTIGISIGSLHSADFEAFLADAMPIVESFQFNPESGASPTPS